MIEFDNYLPVIMIPDSLVGQAFECEKVGMCGEWEGPHNFWNAENTNNFDQGWITERINAIVFISDLFTTGTLMEELFKSNRNVEPKLKKSDEASEEDY